MLMRMGESPYMKSYRQAKTAESPRNTLSRGSAHQLIIQYQMVLSENIHESNITWTRQVIFEREQGMIDGRT